MNRCTVLARLSLFIAGAIAGTAFAAVPRAWIASEPNHPITYGMESSFTMGVNGSAGPVSGVVTFYDGGVPIPGCSELALNVQQYASCSVILVPGTHPITAHYFGAGNYEAVTTGVLDYVVSRAFSSHALASSLNPSAAGQSVTFNAMYSGSFGTPTGTVSFSADGLAIPGCSAVTLNVMGAAACATGGFSLGMHLITSVYSGSDTYAGGGSSTLIQVVNDLTPIEPMGVTLGSTANPSTVGQYVTYTAVVNGGFVAPTGTIVFRDNGIVIDGCGGLVMTDYRASCTIGNQALGTHSMTAVYSGDSFYAGHTSSPLVQVVSAAKPNTPSITLGSSVNPSTFAQFVELTAGVSGAAGTPTGTLVFLDDGEAISGCGGLRMANGQATCTPGSLWFGTNSITTVYSGDAAYNGVTSSTLPQTVNDPKWNTARLTLASSQNPSMSGNVVTFTAVLSPERIGSYSHPGAVTGKVIFRDNGQMISGCGGLALVNGRVTCSPPLNTLGTHSITAIYLGDANYNGITSSVLPQTVQ